ncbi:beta-lactamase [Achlya hypogyna]|uniref:Beta-lactamase n=1 Tax=Achlya hypogyna TaxID=1202772 RepID=A0A1V9Y9Y4_ACHHY|nr:beta-lactamase [Achlya hypogyna]
MRALYLVLSAIFPWFDQLRYIPKLFPAPGPRTLEEKTALALAFVEDQLQQHSIPGLALTVVYKNQTVIARGFGTKEFGNATNVVTPHTQFQIGSVTKTFLTLGIAKLIDEGRMTWDDPVKMHLPWFTLQDKYAEAYTTIGDLLSMNSVFGAFEGDAVWMADVFATERDLVHALQDFNTTRALRPGYAYSNINFEIIGQVLEYKTNTTWAAYLHDTFFKPLGMTHTFARPADAPNADDLSFGHLVCGSDVAGPYDLRTSPEIYIRYQSDYIAAGSLLSTAADMAIFARFLLSKGEGIFSSQAPIQAMTTGHSIQTMLAPLAGLWGYDYDADGDAMGAGYGIDVVGDVMFGHQYYDKSGDTIAFKTRTGFVPSEGLGVVLMANGRVIGGAPTELVLEERLRTYIVGLFLDIPEAKVHKAFDNIIATAKAVGGPTTACDDHIFGGKAIKDLGTPVPAAVREKIVGIYVASISPGYYGNLTIVSARADVVLRYGMYAAPLYGVSTSATEFLWANDAASGVARSVSITTNSTSTMAVVSGITFVKVA